MLSLTLSLTLSVPTDHGPARRPASPWPGSQHQTRHRWQLDGARTLADAARDLRELAAELTAAHAAGWWLAEPMRSGHLLAARASRRQRGQRVPEPSAPAGGTPPPRHRWRLRLVDEPSVPGEEVFDAATADRTPVLEWTDRSLHQVSGPAVAADLLAETTRQVTSTVLASGRWGVAPARVGPSVDLVAHGSALRLHAVRAGALVRTHEALTFQHAADGAATLLEAAAAYERIARAADAMAAAGGRLVAADDGLLHIGYDRS